MSRAWTATVLLTCVAGALSAGVIEARTATIVFVVGAVLSAIWFVVDPWARRLLDKWIPDLKVTIEQDDWDNFRYQARILEVKVRVKNRKNKRKILKGFAFQFQGGGIPADFDIDVIREVERRREDHPNLRNHSILEPHASVSGWMVYALPRTLNPGKSEFTFSVRDELDIEYVAQQ